MRAAAAAGTCVQSGVEPGGVQEQHLPPASSRSSASLQLDQWARTAAATRAGRLRLRRALDVHRAFGLAGLSPLADRLAIASEDGRTVKVVPTTCSSGDHPRQPNAEAGSSHSEQDPGLSISCEHPSHLAWCPDGGRLVVSTQQGASVRVRVFSGTGLVGSFVEPLGGGEALHAAPRTFAGATAIFLVIPAQDGARVVAASTQGCVTARHPPVTVVHWIPAGSDTCLAGLTRDTLYVCTSTQMLAFGLAQVPPGSVAPVAHSWGRSISVWAESRTATAGHALLLVDLAAQRLVQSCNIDQPQPQPQSLPQLQPQPSLGGSAHGQGMLRQGACAVAVQPSTSSTISVLATAGGRFGMQRFTVPTAGAGFEAQRPTAGPRSGPVFEWDPLGRWLAVVGRKVGLSVLDGRTGTPLASWPGLDVPVPGQVQLNQLRWLPDGTGLVCQQMRWTEHESSRRSLPTACVLEFGDDLE